MKKAGTVKIVTLLAISLLWALPAYALRCGTDLVTVGDHLGEVLHKCGPPTFENQWVEHKTYRVYYHDHLPIYRDVYGAVTIIEWTYNFGRHRFMQKLRFENDLLKKIRSLDYGY